ncbi:MAG: S8 family serine peptidase [Tepidisphaeraceae bacterium]
MSAYDTPAYGKANPEAAYFTSTGGATLIFSESGKRFKTAVTSPTPYISAADDISNTFFPTYGQRFRGTSAAAPNAAAIGLLLKALKPDATVDDIRNALVESAKSNPVAGQAAGEYSTHTGWGMVDAVRAAAVLLGSDAKTSATIDRPVNPKSGNVSSLTVHFSTPVTGVDLSDFSLATSFGGSNILSYSKNSVTQIDSQTYVLNGLRSKVREIGTYFISVDGSGIQDGNGDAVAGHRTSFIVELKKVTDLTAAALANGSIRLDWNDSNPINTGFRIQRATDPGFTENVKTFNLDSSNVNLDGAATFTDTTVTGTGVKYYYSVRASGKGGYSKAVTTSAVTVSAGEFIVDNPSSTPGWSGINFGGYGGESLTASFDSTVADADQADDVVYSIGSATRGEYFVYARWTTTNNNATKVDYLVQQKGSSDTSWSTTRQYQVDQAASRSGGWVVLGKVSLDKSKSTRILLSGRDANGTVVADAVRLLPASTPGVDDTGEPTASAASFSSTPITGAGARLGR